MECVQSGSELFAMVKLVVASALAASDCSVTQPVMGPRLSQAILTTRPVKPRADSVLATS